MGQINCQCQEILIEEDARHGKHRKRNSITFDAQPTEIEQRLTQVNLSNAFTRVHLQVPESETITFGTTSDCQQKWSSANNNDFKITVKVMSRSVFVRDCGVGLGAFVLKKKVGMRKGQEVFLSIDDHFLLLNLGGHKISWKIFDLFGEYSHSVELEKELEIQVGESPLLLRRQKSGDQFTLRRRDRKGMFLLLTDQTRIKPHQILRLGCQFLQLQGLKAYTQPITSECEGNMSQVKW